MVQNRKVSLKKANILKHATKAFFLTLLDTHLAVLEYIYLGVDQNRPKNLNITPWYMLPYTRNWKSQDEPECYN